MQISSHALTLQVKNKKQTQNEINDNKHKHVLATQNQGQN